MNIIATSGIVIVDLVVFSKKRAQVVWQVSVNAIEGESSNICVNEIR